MYHSRGGGREEWSMDNCHTVTSLVFLDTSLSSVSGEWMWAGPGDHPVKSTSRISRNANRNCRESRMAGADTIGSVHLGLETTINYEGCRLSYLFPRNSFSRMWHIRILVKLFTACIWSKWVLMIEWDIYSWVPLEVEPIPAVGVERLSLPHCWNCCLAIHSSLTFLLSWTEASCPALGYVAFLDTTCILWFLVEL